MKAGSFLLGLIWGLGMGHGWAGVPGEMTPPLGQAFPLTELNDQGVVQVLFPVAISPSTIIPANAILRVIYVMPQADDASTAQARQRMGMEDSYSRNNMDMLSHPAPTSPEVAAAIKIATETVWPSPVNFRLALENLAGDKRLVYYVPGDASPRQDVLYFPQGLFMGEKDKAVTVLSVENGSPGDKAGIVAGDQIVKIAEAPINGSLQQFFNEERKARTTATAAGAKSVTWTIHAARSDQNKNVEFPLPPSLKSNYFD